MNKLFYIAALPLTLTLAACSRDADFYVHHPEEMQKKLQVCMMLPKKEADADKECVAVSVAINQGVKRALEATKNIR